jgi:glutathione S-transferase
MTSAPAVAPRRHMADSVAVRHAPERPAAMAITLYELAGKDGRRFSPHCWRTRLALAHKMLDAETVPVLFTDKDTIAFSGQTLVPVLRDGDTVVSDSWSIAEYLEEAYPERPSLFGGEAGQTLTRFVNMWTGGGLQLALFPCLAKDIHDHCDPADRDYFRHTREPRLGKTLEQAAAERERHAEHLERTLLPLRVLLRAQPFVAGEEPLYADYIVFGALQWARCVSDFRFLNDQDSIRTWRDRMGALFGGLADREPHYET